MARGTDQLYGLSIFKDGKCGFSARNSMLNLIVLRSPIYATIQPYTRSVKGTPSSTREYKPRLYPAATPGELGDSAHGARAAELNQRSVGIGDHR